MKVMKRLRDDVYVNPQVKRPCASSTRGESVVLPHGPVAVGGGGRNGGGGTGGSRISAGAAAASTQKLTANDALTYLKIVKDMLLDQREKYDLFLNAMKDFKAERIDTAGVITRVKELFKGYPNLILGFNTFLPKGYEITLTDEKEAPSKTIVEFEDAISFVNKIKKLFQNDDHVYKSFLAILNMYRKEHKGIAEVHQEVAALFEDQPDLLDEFTRFLPYSSASALAPHTIMTQSHNDKQLPHQNRINGSHGERDPSFDRPDVDDDKTFLRLHNEDKQHSESESRDERRHDPDGKDHGNENNGDISMHRLCDESKCTQKCEDFGGNSNLPSNGIDCHEFTFCEKVKERLRSSEDYQAFLNCLHIYSTEIITRKELQVLVADLIGNYPDLMEGFYEFVERCERIDGFLTGVMGKKTLWTEGGRSLKALIIEEKSNGQKHELEERKEKDTDDIKYCRKSIQELDLSNCKSCSPSYRLFPKDCLLPSASQRSELDAGVLNNRWVSVTSGSEDYSFKHMRRNQYEETLFRCEDDRFELDMLLESVSSTVKRAEELLNSINNNSIGSDSHIIVEDYFTVLNLRCIERIYGEHGLDVMDILRKNATLALPIILTRLKQKQEEWTRCQLDFNKVWAEIYHKNHYKSLDHQGFYFKQLDSKTLSTKLFVSEIKEMKDKKQKDDDTSFGIAAGSGHSIIPNLEFENTDTEIHEDIYKIIKYSSKEVCSTKEQFNRVLKFWTTFLEPMLGVPSRPDGSEAIGDDSASNHRTVENILESEGSPSTNATSTNLQQSKPDFIGDSNTSIQQINYSWKGFTNVDAMVKDGLTLASNGRLTNTDVVFNTEPDPDYGRGVNSLLANNDIIKEGLVSKTWTKDILSPEGVGLLRSNQSMNGKFPEGSRFDGQTEDSVNHCKIEKEEGELSPNGDFEDNFGCYQDGGSKALPKNDCSIEEMQCRTRCHDDISSDYAGKNDADVEDKDNENAFEAADNISRGESAAVECPQEEHEEEEDGEQDNLDGQALSDGEAENTINAHNIAGYGSSLPPSERFLQTCKPLSKHIATHLVGDKTKDRRVFYGNDTYYVLFRLHQTLYERIFSAKVNSLNRESNPRTTKDMNLDTYASFMDALFNLLDGSSDNAKFEDDCRSLIGNQFYVLFTLDKLIYKLVKQLQTVSSEEVDCKLILLYEYEKSRKQEKCDVSVYYENVNVLLHKENIYRFECTSFPTRLSIQLVDDGSDKSGVVPDSVDPNFSAYLSNEYLSVCGEKESSTMMLKRNTRKYANLDECSSLVMATKKALIRNGLECKMAATSSKVSYAMRTEDSFIRLEERRENRSAERACSHRKRSLQFHKYLETCLLRSGLF